MHRLPVALSCAFLAPLADAQNPGFCGSVFNADVQAKATAALGATWTNFVGACRDKNGEYWATAGNPTASTPGKVVRLDAAGNYVASYNQPAYATTGFAIRDLAYDGNNTIWGGLEVANSSVVAAFDITTQTWDTNTTTGKAWVAPAGATIVRGLAYDLLGNGGAGSMYTSDFTSLIYEFRKDGSIIRSFAPTLYGSTAAPYGLAIDFPNRILWTFTQGGSTHTSSTAGTGYNFIAALDISVNPPVLLTTKGFGNMAGGPPAVPYVTPVAGGCELTTLGGRTCMVCLNQAASDTIAVISLEFAYGTGCGGTIGMTGDGPWAGNSAWSITLSGSTATQAALILGVGEASLPLPIVFKCPLLLPVSPVVVFPVTSVTGGAATQLAPIPSPLAPAKVNFQWVEVNGLTLPLGLSNAAACVVGHL